MTSSRRTAVPPYRRTAWTLWRDLEPRSGALNMAIDQSLLERTARSGERWLRLYTWDPHCLSLGRNERARQRYDRARIARGGLDVVRRPTGGRAVWHARELTYAVAAPAESMGGLRAAYREIHRVLLESLSWLGAAAEMAEAMPGPGLDAGACFARSVGGEIVVGGRKVVGSAQVREGGGLLQHGSILLEDDQRLVRTLTLGEAPPDGSAPLAEILGRSVSPAEAADAVAAAAVARWGGDWADGEADAVLGASTPHLRRFRSTEWTWRA